jgi:hypothetical protein
MKKLTFLLTLLIPVFLLSQPCLPEGITFTTQEQIDNFQTDYPGCSEIGGDVEIYGDNITNLDSLISISSIGGSLVIGNRFDNNQNLISIAGLSQLQYIGGNLTISLNPNLLNLEGLENLSIIEQSLQIVQNNSLMSLSGLNGLTYIGGILTICFNPEIINFEGLNNLSYIGGLEGWWSLDIRGNNSLVNFEGLNDLSLIMGSINIGDFSDQEPSYYNPSLKNFNGLQSLKYIGGDLAIYRNGSLLSLSGLDNLNIIQGELTICENDTLIDFTALENLQIVEHLSIIGNDNLQELTGLDNIVPESLNNLNISYNSKLSYCEVQSICNYLLSPNGTVSIHHNDSGCNNPPEIANNCGNTMPCLPYGDYWIITQAEVDSFQYFYPDCSELEGNVSIGYLGGGYITNLNGLNVINSVGGDIRVSGNDSLQNLTGLNNLSSIGGRLWIQGNVLMQDLTGLENLAYIGGDRFVLSDNHSLNNLTGLDNLEIINGTFYIHYNDSITDLSGLENVISIGSLNVGHNPKLNSLSGLNNSVNLNGLIIRDNSSLNTLSGLEMITSIDGPLYIEDNIFLNSLSGLDNLLSISGDLYIANNDNLIYLNNLNNLSSINGYLSVWGNDVITSLAGLENIENESILNLYIGENAMLDSCHVSSICSYLVNPAGEIRIENNALGCNSVEQIEEACEAVSVEELEKTISMFSINCYPNPFTTSTTIEYTLNSPQSVTITFYNQFGKLVDRIEQKLSTGKQQVVWAPELPGGIYYLRLISGEHMASGKVVLVK